MIRQLSVYVCGLVFAIALLFTCQSSMAADGGHGHDDISHGQADVKELNNLLELKASKSFFSAIVFLILCVVLYAVAWKPISEGLAKREKLIADQIAEAQKASVTAADKLKEYEVKLSEAAVQAQELVAQARKDAESVAERIKAEAQQEATRSRDRALAEIESAKAQALSELTSRSTDIAFGLARKVVGRELNPSDHQKLISDAIGNLPSHN
jgi:F-type H+-transporting ATPase subunit b